MKYLASHFDSVIKQYRELPASDDKWSPESLAVFQRMRQTIGDRLIRQSIDDESASMTVDELWKLAGGWKSIHILDLAADGEIGAHVDHKDYCGRLVSALCLISTAVVRFRHVKDSQRFVDVLLKPGTLYGHTGAVRYDYTHEIVPTARFYEFDNQRFPQQRRLSLMMRSCN